ncbi:GerAB/ArcD/ProY family transporter [Priestia endophytica]
MEKAKISGIQLFAIMFIFELGTALVVNYGTDAGKDAWLSTLLAMSGGVALFFIFYFVNTLTYYLLDIYVKYLVNTLDGL